MELQINKQEIENVLKLDDRKRYGYFIKKVADTGFLWALKKDDDWAYAEDVDQKILMPLWPAKIYAQLCAVDFWKEYKPTKIEIHFFLDEIVEYLKKKGIDLAVFYTPEGRGITCLHEDFINNILYELNKIE
jgi:hypothetical protein